MIRTIALTLSLLFPLALLAQETPYEPTELGRVPLSHTIRVGLQT